MSLNIVSALFPLLTLELTESLISDHSVRNGGILKRHDLCKRYHGISENSSFRAWNREMESKLKILAHAFFFSKL